MQRFSLEDWGYSPEFEHGAMQRHKKAPSLSKAAQEANRNYGDDDGQHTNEITFAKPGTSGNPWKVVVSESPMRNNRPHLAGRGTRLIKVDHIEGLTEEQAREHEKYNYEYVVKVSWPEMKRSSEADMLTLAVSIAKEEEEAAAVSEKTGAPVGEPLVSGHIPTLICSKDLECPPTGAIREALGAGLHKAKEGAAVTRMRRGSRVCRLLVFVKLEALDDQDPAVLFKAWQGCYRCEFLWHHYFRRGFDALWKHRSLWSVVEGTGAQRRQCGKPYVERLHAAGCPERL